MVAAINIGYFDMFFDGVKLDFVSRIQLHDRDGVLMAGKPQDEYEFGKPSERANTLTNLRTLDEGTIVEGTEQFTDGLRLVAYRPAGGFPLVMRVAIDEHEALTPCPVAGGALVATMSHGRATTVAIRCGRASVRSV